IAAWQHEWPGRSAASAAEAAAATTAAASESERIHRWLVTAAAAATTTAPALRAREGHRRGDRLDSEVPARGADPRLDRGRWNRDLADVASRRIGDLELHVSRLVLDKVR